MVRNASYPGLPWEIVGVSDAIQQIVELVDRVADSECPVLIEGETGTGKELVARRLHTMAIRSAKPFIPVNCAGVSDTLFESQFFGHVRGAFTGAEQTMLGLVRAADQGTLFLDEVGEIPLRMQAKLLRVFQDGEVRPVGTTRMERVCTRFIAATNRDLQTEVDGGRFRRDLYYRLNIVRIYIPPLRQRREDIELLLGHFSALLAQRHSRPAIAIPEPVMRLLTAHSWPGNVRELAGWVERLYVTGSAPDELVAALTSPKVGAVDEVDNDQAARPDGVMSLKEAERWAINRALKHADNRLEKAARLLRIHRTTLYRKLRQHDIS